MKSQKTSWIDAAINCMISAMRDGLGELCFSYMVISKILLSSMKQIITARKVSGNGSG